MIFQLILSAINKKGILNLKSDYEFIRCKTACVRGVFSELRLTRIRLRVKCKEFQEETETKELLK
jgi:hypothetical protein